MRKKRGKPNCDECGSPMDLRNGWPEPPWTYWSCPVCAADIRSMKIAMSVVKVKRRGKTRKVHWNKTRGQ